MNNRKIAVYTATRNLYPVMTPSIKSLLAHSTVDEVWLLIEDYKFPEPLPDKVHVMNVSGQEWFRRTGPNYHCGWSYMVLMKVALTKYFPNLDRLVTLDVDTIIVRDIDALWEMDLGDNYFAMAHDTGREGEYYNGGVVVQNLKKLREDGMDDLLIGSLNVHQYEFCEQEAISKLCAGRVLELKPEYNDSDWTAHTAEPRIIHYAAERQWFGEPLVQYWHNRGWG